MLLHIYLGWFTTEQSCISRQCIYPGTGQQELSKDEPKRLFLFLDAGHFMISIGQHKTTCRVEFTADE